MTLTYLITIKNIKEMANFNFNEKMQDFTCEKKRIQNEADIACKRIQLEADMKKQTVADQARRDLAKLNRQMDEFHQKYREWRKEPWEQSHAEAVNENEQLK